MDKRIFISAEEVANELGVSKPYAYKIIKAWNEELKAKGYLVLAGKINRAFYREKLYGTNKPSGRGGDNIASV